MKQLIAKITGFYLNILAIVAPRKAGKAGLNLFCYPFRPTLKSKQKAFLEGAKSGSFKFEDYRIQQYRWGNGPKNILLLHGWQSHTYRWKSYIESLDKNAYTIHAFDAPGHGLSTGKFLSVPLYAEVTECVIDHIGNIDTVISHSLGCFAAFYLFHRNKAITPRKMVAMGSPGEASEFFEFYKKTIGLSERASAVVMNRFEELFQRKPDFFSVPHFASSLTIPGLIVHDEDDSETAVDNAKRIHQSWNNARLVITKGAGHNLKSPEVLRDVVEFVSAPVPATLHATPTL